MDTDVSSSDNIIDSRTVIARIEELKDALEDVHHQAMEDRPLEMAQDFDDWLKEIADDDAHLDQDDAAEYIRLRAFADEAEGYASDWHHGATLINDDYFERYARDLADDICGRAVRDAAWPFDHIDWPAAAEALKIDYSAVEFDGNTYWVR